MYRLAEAKLLAGIIYGDNKNEEYVYLPASEVDATAPVLVYETKGDRIDLTLEEALHMIEKRSLKPIKHPVFGERTF